MSAKDTKALGKPDATGADVLFQVVEEDPLTEPKAKRPRQKSKKGGEGASSPSVAEGDSEKIKTTIYISEQAQDLIYTLKKRYRKDRGQFVPGGDIIEEALQVLAEKLEVKP